MCLDFPFFWWMFHQTQNLLLAVLFFQYLKMLGQFLQHPTVSDDCCRSNACSPVSNVSFLTPFKTFSLVFGSLITTCPSVLFFAFIWFGVYSVFKVDVFGPVRDVFRHDVFQPFSAQPSFSSPPEPWRCDCRLLSLLTGPCGSLLLPTAPPHSTRSLIQSCPLCCHQVHPVSYLFWSSFLRSLTSILVLCCCFNLLAKLS